MTKILKLALLSVTAVVMTACNDMLGSSNNSESFTVCEVQTLNMEDVSKSCDKGNRVLFAPRTFGNEQLPVLFSALYCDHSQSIALTTGGVSCIYKPISMDSLQEEDVDIPQ